MKRVTGKVKWFDTKKGYGFIAPDEGGSDVFVHFSDIDEEGHPALDPEQAVEYEPGETPYGPRAMKVRRVKESEEPAG